MQRAFFLSVSLVCCGLSGTASLRGEDPKPEADPHFEYLLKRLEALTVRLDDREAALQRKPLFRWQNPVSGADGAVFVWTLQDRPVALAKTHLNDQKTHYVETMVAVTPKPFHVEKDSQGYWSPPGSGVKPAVVKDVDPPAEAVGVRLTQMRAIARNYRFTSFWGEENRSEWELRLLSTPLHRYRNPAAGVIDGAIFGFAQGTNPEAIVVIEAIETLTGKHWEAVPQRLSGYAIKAWREDELVLDVPYLQRTPNNLSFFHLYERPMPYPFPKAEAKSP